MRWFLFTAYRPNGTRVYRRGPVRMKPSDAGTEAAELTEAFWDVASVRVYQWSGSSWERWL